jgi:hypothetical protein
VEYWAGGIPTGGIPTGGIPTGGIPTGGIPTGGCPTGGITTGGITTGGIGGSAGDSRAPTTVCVTVWIVDEMLVAMLDELTAFVWVTSPSLPGLRIRIEIEVLHISHETGGGFSAVVQSQFQIQVDAARSSGLISAGVVLPSPEFHDQFQTQVDGRLGAELGADVLVVAGGAAGISGVELIPPELPL